jgi:hypothetical protein
MLSIININWNQVNCIKKIRWRVVIPHNQRFKKSEKLAQGEKKSIDVRFLVSKVYLFGVRMFHENS